MKCERCGREISDDVGFCPFCGASYIDHKLTEVKTSEVEVYVDEVDEEIARRKKFVPLYAFLIVLGASIGVTSAIEALKRAIVGQMQDYWMIYVFIVFPAILLIIGGILAIVLTGNRKLAKKTLQKQKKEKAVRRTRKRTAR